MPASKYLSDVTFYTTEKSFEDIGLTVSFPR